MEVSKVMGRYSAVVKPAFLRIAVKASAWELLDGVGQVVVGEGGFAEEPCNFRQHFFEVDEVELFEDGGSRNHWLNDEGAASGFEDAVELLHSFFKVFKVPDAEAG